MTYVKIVLIYGGMLVFGLICAWNVVLGGILCLVISLGFAIVGWPKKRHHGPMQRWDGDQDGN